MDKILAPIKQRVLKYLETRDIDKNKFYKDIGVAASNFRSRSLYSEIGGEVIAKISSKYVEINPTWLLTGEGPMLKAELPQAKPATGGGIPLIPVTTYAGFGAGPVQLSEQDILDRYVIPDFVDVDFMIRVKGASMKPNFASGDIVACRMLRDRSLFQWGRVFVLHHRDQGTFIKRLFPGTDTDHLECRSDNADFPPFTVPVSDITNFALVIGVVRLE